MPPPYAELHCLSNFTFLRGASHPEELVARAHALGYEALALTDECSLAGVVRAHVAAKTYGFALLIGTEVRITDGPRLVLLATDRDAYGDLSALITAGRRRAGKGRYHLRRADLETGLCACLALLLPEDTQRDEEETRWLARRFPGRAWIAVELVRGGADRARLQRLEGLGLPLCAAGAVHMHSRERRPLQDTLTAIRLGTPLESAGHALYPNGERHLRRSGDAVPPLSREALDRNPRDRAALPVLAGRIALRVSGGAGAGGRDAGEPPPVPDPCRYGQALAGRGAGQGPGPGGA